MPDDLAALAARRLVWVRRRAEADEEIRSIDARLLAECEPGAVLEVDGVPAFRVQRGSLRFNAARAAEVLPAELLAMVTVQRVIVDPDTAKRVLPPALYEQCCKADRPSVRKA